MFSKLPATSKSTSKNFKNSYPFSASSAFSPDSEGGTPNAKDCIKMFSRTSGAGKSSMEGIRRNWVKIQYPLRPLRHGLPTTAAVGGYTYPAAAATTTALVSPCLATGIASGTSTKSSPLFSPSPCVNQCVNKKICQYLGVPGGTWGYLPPAIGRFWQELIYFMAMGGPQLQTFGFLLRLWSLFVTGGGLLALFHTCAALALSTIALTTHIAVLSLQIVVFSPVISVSLLFLTYVVLIKCAIRAVS